MMTAMLLVSRYYLARGAMIITANDPDTGEEVMMLEQSGQKYVDTVAKASELSVEKPAYARGNYGNFLDGPKVLGTIEYSILI